MLYISLLRHSPRQLLEGNLILRRTMLLYYVNIIPGTFKPKGLSLFVTTYSSIIIIYLRYIFSITQSRTTIVVGGFTHQQNSPIGRW